MGLLSVFSVIWFGTDGYVMWYSYATRVRSIINDASKNLTTKEILRLKKQVQFWKERAGNLGGEELEEVVEDRSLKSAEWYSGPHSHYHYLFNFSQCVPQWTNEPELPACGRVNIASIKGHFDFLCSLRVFLPLAHYEQEIVRFIDQFYLACLLIL